MATSPRHIIKRQLVELNGLNERDAQDLQQRLLPRFYQHIVPLIDQYCSQLSPDARPFRIDRLELDLGTLPAERLEQAFLEALSAHLKAFFEPLIQSQRRRKTETEFDSGSLQPTGQQFPPGKEQVAKTSAQPVASSQRALQLVQQVVETGSLPWWAEAYPAAGQDPLTEALTEVLTEASSRQQFLRLLQQWTQQPARLARLVRLFRFPVWGEMAALGMDLPGGELTELIGKLSQGLNQVEPSPTSLRQTQERLGEHLLRLRFQVPGSKTYRPDFWEALLRRWAREHSMTYSELVAQLLSFAQAAPDSPSLAENSRQLQSILQELSSISALQASSPFRKRLTVLRQRIRVLRQLAAGLPPETQRQLSEFQQQMETKLRETPSPTEKGFAPQLRRWEQTLDSLEQAAVAFQGTSLPSDLAAKQEEGEAEAEIFTEKDSFSDAEELFVGNAGLVILWPYLIRWLENLGLVSERAFIDEAAQHRAVGLLQYLADGQADPAEYRCGLNKILCGLDWDAVLDFGEAVSESEVELCEGFLQAVIANAPILGEMSIDGFRGSFLLRKGILRAGPGSWLLQVERQAYDIVLEKFPWNWGVVKLPWMRWAVGVEW